MPNQVRIQITRFVDVDNDGNESKEPDDYGFRAFDSYANIYGNSFKKEELIGKTPAELVKLVEDFSDEGADMIDIARNNHAGISIGNRYYTWEEIDTP